MNGATMLVLVLEDLDHFNEILEGWEEVGVPGVTVLNSLGSHRLRHDRRDDIPLVPSLRSILESTEVHNRTLFSVISDPNVLEKAIEVALRVVGDFEQPHNGIMFTVPIGRAWGHTRIKSE